MNRDPLFHKIVEGLKDLADGNAFEQCAVALLSKAHPNLAPLPGGDDAGMDGAFGTPDGPYPLICTVQGNVLGNFRKNVETYRAKCNGPPWAIVATSQSLTNRRKRNLEIEAAKHGVTLVNTYDEPYFANQLYRDPKWRLQLLGIIGDLPALSALPRRGRFSQPGLLVGRDEDLAWLKEVRGDSLLVGQPGSGKTYLHQHLADQKLCLFAVDNSAHRLTEAIREQQPSIVVVDDAHFDLALVQDLHRLRAALGAEFDLHLNCWPRHESAVQRILDIPDDRVRRLEPLRRQDIFSLIKQLGIKGPDWLQHLLISQSDGKPGLAVALAEVCKVADIARIWSGEAAAQQLLADLRLVKDEKEKCVLAAFAMGGDEGMSFAEVSRALGVPPLDLRQMIVGLGSGGLVEEVGDDRLQVRPPAIRPVLVRDVFYRGASALAVTPLLDVVRSPASTASVLLSARQRGAVIDQSVLEQFVTRANKRGIWEHFGGVDEQCATALLDKYPEHVCAGAPGLLSFFPTKSLHALLDADDATTARQAGAVDHPRRRINEWLFPFEEEDSVTIERRQLLLGVLEDRVRQNRVGNGASFTWALTEALRANFDVARQSPGNQREIQCIRGVASHAVLSKIVDLWPRVRELVRNVPNSTARSFFDQLEYWCLPQRLSMIAKPLPKETTSLVQDHGQRMLADMLELPTCNRAWRSRAATIANWSGFTLQIDVDPTFDAVYADRDYRQDWEAEQRKRIAELQEIAGTLAGRPRDETLQYLDDLRSEAMQFGYREGSSRPWVIYERLAGNCDTPGEWLDALIARNSAPEFLLPFVDRLAAVEPDQYDRTLYRLLSYPDYRSIAINRAIRRSSPNEGLLAAALELLHDAELVEHLWLRDPGIPIQTIAKLLSHADSAVRGAAAMGEWQREPTGTVRDELNAVWRVAIRDVDANHYALKDVFDKDSALAFEWLHSQLGADQRRFFVPTQGLDAACKVLNKDQRRQLLWAFNRKNYSDECFDLVMGKHIDLFTDWLKSQTDEYLRLQPLDRELSPRWERMALLALDAGVSAEDLADHCTPNHWGGFGPHSQYFLAIMPAYEALSKHQDQRLRLAGQRGLSWVRSHADCEVRQERWAEVYGE